MGNKHTLYETGFGCRSFIFDCSNNDALDLARFLFADLPGPTEPCEPKRFEIIFSGPKPMVSLWDEEKKLYFGDSPYQLAYILMNEVIHHCIDSADKHIALHAGAVFSGNNCILLPGKSGKGKSTLTGWLTTRGFHYLTDELVLLGDDGTLSAMPRPVNLKVTDTHKSWLLPGKETANVLFGNGGAMIPHRLLNPDFQSKQPRLTHIVFPQYENDSELQFEEISPAKSCLHLLQSHVNARNLAGHGIGALSAIVRRCRSYTLKYSRFADLEGIFNRDSILLQ